MITTITHLFMFRCSVFAGQPMHDKEGNEVSYTATYILITYITYFHILHFIHNCSNRSSRLPLMIERRPLHDINLHLQVTKLGLKIILRRLYGTCIHTFQVSFI